MASRRLRGVDTTIEGCRTNLVIDTAKYIERNIPNFEIMNLTIEIIEEKAEEVLENIGVKFLTTQRH